jgi:hypothetical protein
MKYLHSEALDILRKVLQIQQTSAWHDDVSEELDALAHEIHDLLKGEAEHTPRSDQLVIDLARELYDRFVMGGWEPSDAYQLIREMLGRDAEAPRNQQDERADFEKWAKLPPTDESDNASAWQAWQARAELREAEAPRRIVICSRCDSTHEVGFCPAPTKEK